MTKFKDYYDQSYLEDMAGKFQVCGLMTKSQCNYWLKKTSLGLNDLEFSERLDYISDNLHYIWQNQSYPNLLKKLNTVLGKPLQQDTGMFTYGWWLWPVSRYIQSYSVAEARYKKATLSFIKELTRRFTGEFAIRPLLQADPEYVLAELKKWSREKCVHVRRCSSESIRIHLPWAFKMSLYPEYEKECFEILNVLAISSEKFVLKSVGNNINDLFKSHPEIANKLVSKISKHNHKSSDWVIKHGLRNQSSR